MYSLKKSLKSYFSYSKKELNGILLLCILITLILAFPYVSFYLNKPESYDLETFKSEILEFKASAVKKQEKYKGFGNQVEDRSRSGEYFVFDPNDLSEGQWQKLGLSAKQIRVIKNYESKGGRFYKSEDLKKIYSISPSQFAKLEPFIHITSQRSMAPERDNSTRFEKNKPIREAQVQMVVELNNADSALLVSVRGIGPVFASRMIRYRERLGGYYAKEQLKEIYGIDSIKYSLLKDLISVDAALIKKINLNTATFEDFRRHPYLSFKQMNAIIQYRKQHGFFRSMEDLKKVDLLNEEIIRKIEPYTSF